MEDNKKEKTILVEIPVKCIGCSCLITVQHSISTAISSCRDKKLFMDLGVKCHRSTNYTD